MGDKHFLYQDELLQEALREFADKGFDSASLNQIIKRSGISKGGFYHHFHNKEELFYRVVDRAAQEKLAFVSQWSGRKGWAGETAGFFDTLTLMMEGSIAFAFQHPDLSQFWMSIMKNPQLRAKIMQISPGYYNRFLDPLVDAALETGQLRADLDPDFIKKMVNYSFLNMGELLLDSSGDELDRETMERLVRQFLSFLQYGLGAAGGEPHE